jgi:hypothetical protein
VSMLEHDGVVGVSASVWFGMVGSGGGRRVSGGVAGYYFDYPD